MSIPITRLFVEEALTAQQELVLSPAQARYVRVILRGQYGDLVALFNHQDGEWFGYIIGLDKNWVTIKVEKQVRTQEKEVDIWLLFSPIKHIRLHYLIEKVTELGVSKLVPVMTERTIIGRINLDRLRANTIQAAQQSQRISIPTIADPVSLNKILADWPRDRALFVCVESGPALPMIETFITHRDKLSAILTGPEGGFTNTELEHFTHYPFITRIHLGSRLVRSETAAIAALACWQAVTGEWTSKRTVVPS